MVNTSILLKFQRTYSKIYNIISLLAKCIFNSYLIMNVFIQSFLYPNLSITIKPHGK